MTTPIQYLDKAMTRLRDLGLVPEKTEEAPVVALLNRVADLDQDKVVAIARTLSQASLFNQVVRDQISSMKLGERYATITDGFNSIRADAKSMVEQIEDGRINTWERLSNVWQKATRGDIASRFEKVKRIYLDVVKDSKEQIDREHVILQAYLDFRGALKESEVLALQVLKTAEGELEKAQAKLKAAVEAVEQAPSTDLVARAKLELKRDEELRNVQGTEDRYQICKDLSDNLTIGYNTSEVVMARLVQTTNAKDRVYKQAVSFFGTNETVFTALSASFTGLWGLHESTKTLEAMKEGVSQSLEDLADIGGKVQEAALKAGYGPTIRADAVKKLVDSVVNYQLRSREIIAEMRDLSTKNAAEIRDAVEQGKQRLAKLVQSGEALEMAALPKS
ncbi:MAG TPA: cell surface protein [Gammaproteobacteria bacterium]|nr:cell surface protein [Gammaproteobacteria bacterium]